MTRPRRGAGAHSAGLLLHRRGARGQIQVLIGHMGGPFWVNRDDGGWSIPKGEYEPGESPLAAACREFAEEIGKTPPDGEFVDLGEVTQPKGKLVHVWALEGDMDVSTVCSNTFELEWPPRSGRRRSFPEIDRAAWFDLQTARRKLVKGQAPFIDTLAEMLGASRRAG